MLKQIKVITVYLHRKNDRTYHRPHIEAKTTQIVTRSDYVALQKVEALVCLEEEQLVARSPDTAL